MAIHRAMDNHSPSACKHLAVKAEKYGKEFPFIYCRHKVTNIPDHHAEAGDVVVRCSYRQRRTLMVNFSSAARGHGFLRSFARHLSRIIMKLIWPSWNLPLDQELISTSMPQSVLMLFAPSPYEYNFPACIHADYPTGTTCIMHLFYWCICHYKG